LRRTELRDESAHLFLFGSEPSSLGELRLVGEGVLTDVVGDGGVVSRSSILEAARRS
jgi:hypothetical protein